MLFKLANRCIDVNIIPNCSIYDTINECSICAIGFMPVNET